MNAAGVLWALVIGVFVFVAYQLLAPSSIFRLFHKMQQSRRQDLERILAKQRGLSSLTVAELRIPAIATTHSSRSRPPVPIDRDQCGAGARSAAGCSR